jgi:ParB family chromosome partitioning protein
MARKDIFGSVMGPATTIADAQDVSSYAVRGASRSIIQSFEELSKSSVVDLDPGLVDTSFVSDRMDDDDEAFQELLTAIRERGQDSPILVRPHPEISGRFQTVFGHRRVRVARQLERPVRAVVKKMDDRDHVIAQGQENAARADLSFIERTLFADRILKRGHSPDTVKSALALDDAFCDQQHSRAGHFGGGCCQRHWPRPLVAACKAHGASWCRGEGSGVRDNRRFRAARE